MMHNWLFRFSLMLIALTASTAHASGQNVQLGTFETHRGPTYDWWRITLHSDSSFVFEDLTLRNMEV
jgi:hypothetical protein